MPEHSAWNTFVETRPRRRRNLRRARPPEVLLDLRRCYRDAKQVQRGYTYTYGPGETFEHAFVAALVGEFERLVNPRPGQPSAGWIEVDVRSYPFGGVED